MEANCRHHQRQTVSNIFIILFTFWFLWPTAVLAETCRLWVPIGIDDSGTVNPFRVEGGTSELCYSISPADGHITDQESLDIIGTVSNAVSNPSINGSAVTIAEARIQLNTSNATSSPVNCTIHSHCYV